MLLRGSFCIVCPQIVPITPLRIGKNVDNKAFYTLNDYYLVDFAYPYLPKLSEEERVLWVYKEVLAGIRRHFPPLYFQSVKGEERAKICFDYMFYELMGERDIYVLPQIFGKTERAYSILKKHRLKILVDTLYFSPFDMVTEMYPILNDPVLWKDY